VGAAPPTHSGLMGSFRFRGRMSGPEYPPIAPPGYHIACGKSPRLKHQHAVVALDGKIVHDPHPTRAGLDGEIASWILLIPLATQ
jgi:hypothetical protein